MKKIFYSLMVAVAAAFTFTSCEDVPMPYDQPGTGGGSTTTIDPAGSGTAADPYNIAALNNYAKTLESGQSSDTQIYFRGKVSTIKEAPGNSYGNATFYLSDDGSTKNQFYVYRCMGPGNAKITDENLFKEGDELVVCGTITNYNGTYETEQNKAYIVSVNGTGGGEVSGSTTEPAGTGTEADPFNVAAAIAKAKETGTTETSTEYYIKGKVLANNTSATTISSYGNMTFTMVDEGTDSPVFTAFQVYGPGKEKFTSADQIKAGQTVVVCGKIVNYQNNTPETVGKGASYVVSIEGEGTSTGGDDEPAVTGAVATYTASGVTAGTTTTTIDLSTLGFTNGEAVTTVTFPDGATVTFGANGETNGPKYYDATKGVRVYKNTLTFEGKGTIAKIEFTCDSYSGTDYVGNDTATTTFSGASAVYTNTFTGTSGGGVQLRVKAITITYAK